MHWHTRNIVLSVKLPAAKDRDRRPFVAIDAPRLSLVECRLYQWPVTRAFPLSSQNVTSKVCENEERDIASWFILQEHTSVLQSFNWQRWFLWRGCHQCLHDGNTIVKMSQTESIVHHCGPLWASSQLNSLSCFTFAFVMYWLLVLSSLSLCHNDILTIAKIFPVLVVLATFSGRIPIPC